MTVATFSCCSRDRSPQDTSRSSKNRGDAVFGSFCFQRYVGGVPAEVGQNRLVRRTGYGHGGSWLGDAAQMEGEV